MAVSTIFLVMLLALMCQGQIDLGTCNLQCDNDGDGSSSSSTHQPPIRIQGAPGKRGVIGLTGSKGDLGTTGLKGDQGTTGLKGDQGTTGLKGDQGTTGSKGDQGPTGSKGDQGPTGSKGDRGPKGDPAECQCPDIEDLKRELLPQTCKDFLPSQGVDNNGVYSIYPYGNGDMTHLRVYCDLKTDGGGWIVFQKRIDGSEDFYRNFNDYVNGFGRLDGEFWLGLDALHKLTKDGEYEMRVDMEDFENQTRYALYRDFVVGVGTDYIMTFGGYSGTAGSALTSARFSAKDRDQDTNSGSCSETFKGGWWYTACHAANPNGLYLGGPHESFADGVEWKPFRGYHYSLKQIEMKLRKK